MSDQERAADFDPRLESLRGLASLAVVLAHTVAVLRVDGMAAHWAVPLAQQTPASMSLMLLTAVFNPSSAVVLFFVLSGFVLSLSVVRSSFTIYLMRRLLRLLPPMWASILLLAGLLQVWPPTRGEPFSAFFNYAFHSVTAADLWNNLTLQNNRVNAVTWTMYVELIGSICIPLFLLARGRQAWGLLLITVAIGVWAYPLQTFAYLFCFQLGVLLAREQPKLPPAAIWVAMLLFALERLWVKEGIPSLLLNGGAAALMIAAVRNGAWSGLLRSPLLRWLGRASFSLYLLHPLALYLTSQFAGAWAGPGLSPHLAVAALALPLSLLFATTGYWLLEKPSIAAGRALARMAKCH